MTEDQTARVSDHGDAEPTTVNPFAAAAAARPGLRGYGSTHQGNVRSHNEDSMLTRDQAGIWMIADGVGGASAGDWASAQVVEVLREMRVAERAPDFLVEAIDRLYEANSRMLERASTRGSGMIATTVVLLLAHGWHYTCIWAGDSRGYLLRGGKMEQITHDHSEVQELLDAGALTPDEAERYPRANVITRALGISAEVDLDRVAGRLQAGDRFLICTDGLTKMVPEPQIAAVLAEADPSRSPQILLQMALDAGGLDNVTVVVVQCDGPAGAASHSNGAAGPESHDV